jgi:hypothetical protein
MSVVSTDIEPLTFIFEDDGLVPNNPMPFLVYKGAVDVANDHPEKTIEGLFGANGWGAMWRNGVYDYAHYHATVHEVLGVARGHARVQFGGDHGKAPRYLGRRRCDPARGDRPPVDIGQRRFLRGRRLSAGTTDADHAADAGEPCEGAEDHSGSEAAEDRPGARRRRPTGPTVEAQRSLSEPVHHLGGRNSPSVQPTALDSSGSYVTVLVSVWPHCVHSNVRCSKPPGPSETADVIIRASQSGQRGRSGKSSGGAFSQASMTLTQR